MEVKILSKEMIKPSSSKISLIEPYKLSLLDQLTPSTYVPIILFYLNFPQNTIHHLKNSLSQALNFFYPFSGMIRNNFSVNRFDTGVSFSETLVSFTMAEFLKQFNEEITEEALNQFLPFRSFYRETNNDYSPIIAFQVNRFPCGGAAIGLSFSHKLCDGSTISLLLKHWAAIYRNSHDEFRNRNDYPNLYELSSLFPPRQSLPQNYVDVLRPFWFKEVACNNVTRRFLFSHNAIASLKEKAKSKSIKTPSRIQTLTGFIWKHVMKALKDKKAVLKQVMNMRPRMKPNVSSEAMGNPIWWATVSATETVELDEIVGIIYGAMNWYKSVDFKKPEKVLKEYLKKLEEQVFGHSEEIIIIAFSSWISLFKETDFGRGMPFWITPMGKAGPEFVNTVLFIETIGGGGIEAWVTMDEKIMKVLAHDIEFLAFTSNFNCTISKL